MKGLLTHYRNNWKGLTLMAGILEALLFTPSPSLFNDLLTYALSVAYLVLMAGFFGYTFKTIYKAADKRVKELRRAEYRKLSRHIDRYLSLQYNSNEVHRNTLLKWTAINCPKYATEREEWINKAMAWRGYELDIKYSPAYGMGFYWVKKGGKDIQRVSPFIPELCVN